MRENYPLSGTPSRKAVAANVRVELARAGISGHAMAQRLNMPQSNFARRVNGAVSFSAEEIAAIAGELGISPTVLLAPETVSAGAA